MPFIASIGTYLPCWGTPHHRIAGDDEDAITPAVEAGRAALGSGGAVVDLEPAGALCSGEPPRLPTFGASSGLFALASATTSHTMSPLVAVEQANLSGITVTGGEAQVIRREPAARPLPDGTLTPGADLAISPAAYERAFESKVRWEAGRHTPDTMLDFPPRYRVGADCALDTDYELVPLPRTGTVYTEATVQIPVPGMRSPYSPVITELDGPDVRVPVEVAGAEPGSVDIGDHGPMALRRAAVRSGVPDYGYAFDPDAVEPDAA